MSSYSDFVGYVPDKLRLQLSGTVTGEGLIPANNVGLPNEFFVSTAQGITTTSGGVRNPGICLNTSNSNFNIESGVTFISFQNIVSANGDLTISGESGVTTLCEFPKFEYSAGNITGVNSRPNQYNFSALRAIEGNICISGAPTTGSTTLNFSGLRRAKGFLFQYNASGTISGLDSAFKSFIACIVPNPVTGIKNINLSVYPFTGYVESAGNQNPLRENSIYILPSGGVSAQAPSGITVSSTFTGDFLSGLKQGSVTFYNPNNFTEIKLAQNFLNPVPIDTPALFNYIVTSGVTGVTFPPVSGYVYYVVTLNSGAASATPLDIQVKTTGGSGTLLGFAYRTRSTEVGSYKRVNITFSGYSAVSGTRVITALNPDAGFVITCYNTSGVFVSGNDLTRFLYPANTNLRSAYMTAIVGPLTYTATGTALVFDGAGTFDGGLYFAASGSSTTGTFNFLNALIVSGSSGAYASYGDLALDAIGFNSRATLNLPQATGLYTAINATATSNGTVVIDAPLLATGDANANITIQATGVNSATGILILGHPLANNQISIDATANVGRVIIDTTGGTPTTSGSFNSNITLRAASGGTLTGNLGATSAVSGEITVSSLTTGIVSLTATGLTGVASFTTIATSTGSLFVTGRLHTATTVDIESFSGGTTNCIFTGITTPTGNISTIDINSISGTTTGTFNNTATFGNVTVVVGGGGARAVINATGVTGANSIGIRTSSTGFASGNFQSLENVTGNLVLSGFLSICSGGFNIPNLKNVGGSFIISGNASGGALSINGRTDLSGFNTVTGISTVTFSTSVPAFQVTGVGSTFSGAIIMTGLKQIGTGLSSTGAPGLNNNYLSRIEATGTRSLELPNLTGWYGSINIDLPAATGFNLSNVQFIGGNGGTTPQPNTITGLIFTIGTGVTGNISMTGLQYIYVRNVHTSAASANNANPFIFRASGATSISMPNIITGLLFQPTGNFTNTGSFSGASITGLSFGSSGITKELKMNFTASGCPLNQASVDDILKTFASLDGTNSTTVYSGLTIRLNGLCSAPSAAGSGYRTTLTGAGRLNTVLVN